MSVSVVVVRKERLRQELLYYVHAWH
jgi:hypothetical protein